MTLFLFNLDYVYVKLVPFCVGIWAMCGKSSSSGRSGLGCTIKQKDSRIQRRGMEFESDWTTHRKSSAFTAQAIRSATSFMPWSCKISRNEGFHEFP